MFLIRVQFRRNTSWQGTLQSMNSRKSCIFRRVLEMGYLIYNERLTALGLDGEKGFQLSYFKYTKDNPEFVRVFFIQNPNKIFKVSDIVVSNNNENVFITLNTSP